MLFVAESLDLDLAYLTSWELHHDPDVLAGAVAWSRRGTTSTGTVPMRRQVEAARDAGVNLAFLGANALYWRVRYSDHGRLVTCYKSAALDPKDDAVDTTAKWRQAPRPDPENSLVGMLYEAFPAEADLEVHDPDFFLFAGTGARRGSRYAGLVAVEIDRAYPIAGTPPNLQVVAHSAVPQFQKPDTYSDMTYYTVPSGAGVFAVGTMSWTAGLRGPGHGRGSTPPPPPSPGPSRRTSSSRWPPGRWVSTPGPGRPRGPRRVPEYLHRHRRTRRPRTSRTTLTIGESLFDVARQHGLVDPARSPRSHRPQWPHRAGRRARRSRR